MEPNFFRTVGAADATARSRSRRRIQVVAGAVVVLLLGGALYAIMRGGPSKTPPGKTQAAADAPKTKGGALAGDRPVVTPLARMPVRHGPATQPQLSATDLAAQGHVPLPITGAAGADRTRELAAKMIEADAKLAAKALLAARKLFNEAVDQGLPAADNAKCVAQLAALADQTLLSSVRIPNDPLTDFYQVPPGGVLAKIATRYKVRYQLLEKVNNIKATSLQANQTIKVINGPFNAVVDKSALTLSVYVSTPGEAGKPGAPLLVRRFRVGLGEHDSTPTGVWKIKNMQAKPPYNHPRTGKSILPDDPAYPFGKLGYWIALDGLEGNAVGQLRYGIHSTNEPDSIGKKSSLGCVRMLDADVQQVWDMLRVDDSRVTVRD
ncbi:MAG: L,D-transpeptidase family protein [Phycisphaerae bacterium]|nr:L,D-transpeptidase family protein [Phycisphaerae bacterium]